MDDPTGAPSAISAPQPWQWVRRSGSHAELARFVSADAARELRLVSDRSLEEPDLDVVGRLYKLLQDQSIGYAPEPHLPKTGTQMIRDPWLLMRTKVGTCVDFATTYAAMCLDVAARPLLGVTDHHAFVLIAPGLMLDDPHPDLPIALDGFAHADGELAGVLQATPGAFASASLTGALVAIDCTLAKRGGRDFQAALSAGRDWAEAPELMLIDVLYLQHLPGLGPLDPPPGHAPIHTYVPADDTPFVTYDSHRATIESLRGMSGTSVALLGPPGQGKSRIARELARSVPLGGGWLLDASEPQTLINSLAGADLAGRAEPPGGRARPDREGYAQNARGLLAETKSPWLVVLDNADSDPGRIEHLLPVPGEEQLVLLTTTNPAWAQVKGVQAVVLPPIDPSEIREEMRPLTALIGGLPLLLQAYSSVMLATGWSAEQVAEHDPGEEHPLRGQAALFAAVRRAPGFGEPQLHATACAAFLPPDHQPLAAFELLAPGAGETAARFLAAHGLHSYELELGGEGRATLRLHRTFSAAIRAEFEEFESDLCDATVRAIAAHPGLRELLDVHGDVETVTRLALRLTQIDVGASHLDPRLGESLHGVAELLELHGQTRLSGEVFALAERHLEDGLHQAMVAACRHGRARTVNQHHQNDEALLREAVEWARSARRLLIDERCNADHCLAMEGLLRQKLASFPGPGETELDLLTEALAMIEDADERRNRPGSDVQPAELARSRFNLGGIRIRLAQSEPSRTERHLDRAWEIYEEVRDRRRRIYHRDIHPHVAACIIGLAYVDYYRALLLPASHRQRSQWLRGATVHATEALAQRSALEGSIDLDEVGKVSAFLMKVALARAASPVTVASRHEDIYAKAMSELSSAAIVLERVAPLPSEPAELAGAIDGWVRSPALRVLVAEFDGAFPEGEPLDALLAWLEEFSTRWDYRAGNERNLVASPRFAPATRKVTLAAAEALGLIGSGTPRHPSGEECSLHYDDVLILGGLVRACLARPLHAAKLLTDGTVEADRVTALGGFRAIAGDEHGLVEKVLGDQEQIADEFHAMQAGVRNAFDIVWPGQERGEHSDVVGASWRVTDLTTTTGLPVRVVAAPSSEPGVRRANTPDTYVWYATELARLQPGQRLLVVTTEIYVPFQHADALRMLALPYGVQVDVAGVDPGKAHPALRQIFEPHNYLQEVRSTIRALRALYRAL